MNSGSGSESRWPHDPNYLEARAGLKGEIAKLIKPYLTNAEEPPFETAEMIVMALISSDKEYTSQRDILSWIVKAFRYYSNKAVDEYASTWERYATYNVLDQLETVVGDFYGAFSIYEMPLVEGERLRRNGNDHHLKRQFSVDTRSARVYLRTWLEPEREGTFRFFDLPPELRNNIYEMALQFPDSGLYLNRRNELECLEWESGGAEPCTRWQWKRKTDGSSLTSYTIELPLQEEVLALLLVCKQMTKEAVTIFYDINTFCFQRIDKYVRLAKEMETQRFSSINKVYIEADRMYRMHVVEAGDVAALYRLLTPGEMENRRCEIYKSWAPFTTALAQQKGHKHLAIALSDEDWTGMREDARRALGRKSKYTKISQISGFDQLAIAASKADKFELLGDCPLIREFLEAEIQKIKSGVGKVSKLRAPAKPRKKRTKMVAIKYQTAKKESSDGAQTLTTVGTAKDDSGGIENAE